MNIKDSAPTIDAMLRHLACGQDLRDFLGTPSEKLALIRTACTRELIMWRKARGRYELTSIGWSELTPSRRFSLASLMVSTAIGAAVGAASLAIVWLPSESSHRSIRGQPPVSRLERAVAASAPSWTEVSVRSPLPPQTASGSLSGVPVVAYEPGPTEIPGNPIEPPMAADLSVPEQPSAEAPPTIEKQAVVKKSRHKTAYRRRRGSTWAYSDRRWRARQFRYADYGAQGAWLGYR